AASRAIRRILAGAQEGLEVGLLLLLRFELLQHRFGDAESGPARHSRREIHVAPFWMERRVLQPVKAVEQILDETLDLGITIGLFRPVVDGQHGGNGDRVYAVVPLQKVWI